MTSVCFDALPDHSRQCEYAFAQLFARIIRANSSRQCETALTPEQLSLARFSILAAKKYSLLIFAVFSAIAWNFKAKFYARM